MVPGFTETSNTFPTPNEIINITQEFYKCDCVDFFFDFLSPELTLKGTAFFFKSAFILL